MGSEGGLKDEGLKLDKLQDPGDRYQLLDKIGHGIFANVHVAADSQSGMKKVAVKIQKVTEETLSDIEEEYRILRDLSSHPNLPDFYGVYKRSEGKHDFVWFVMELCEGGPVTDLVRALIEQNKKMPELHIAFVLKETLKALVFLHENHVIHRDVKGSNILLTKNGEVKLVDFGLARELSSTLGRRKTNLGTPCWMAPEVVTMDTEYDNRADVWALGMTAIEIGDGKNPFQDMHPTRVLFQIVRNPPPTLYRPANWSQNYNDFIAECLVKNPEHRPYMGELMEHPFFTELPDNDFHLNAELKMMLEGVTPEVIAKRRPESKITTGLLKKEQNGTPERMQVEDLAALEVINEDTIFNDLETRYKKGQFYTFVGDVLLFLNPNKEVDVYGISQQVKYKLKSRSDNAPHIFSVADSAYQDMMHHEQAQNILITGETMSGKTTQFKHLLKHLVFLGTSGNRVGDKIQKGLELVHALGNAATPLNRDSTRHVLNLQVTFSKSGRTSGAIFWLYQLEKWRVTGNRCPQHANFHIFYYLFDGMKAEGDLGKYHLEGGRSYRYLRREIEAGDKDPRAPPGPREDTEGNVERFKRLKKVMTDLDFEEEQSEVLWKTLAAVLLLGEVEFTAQDDGNADIRDYSLVEKIAELLSVDGKKLSWALCNYCVIEKDTAARRRHSRPEAIEAKNVLARVIYARLVDWMVNSINVKLSLSRAVFGDTHCVNLLDAFGFECYPNNGLEQLFANTFNEQFQYYYNQKIFIAEMDDLQEDEVPLQKLQFYDNKITMDELMNKPNGVLYLLDEANKMHRDADYMIEMLKTKVEGSRVRKTQEFEFSVAHYTGKVQYDASLMVHKNREFLPPELTEVMRHSSDAAVKSVFTNKLSRTGNVTTVAEIAAPSAAPTAGKKRWGAALMSEPNRTRRINTASRGEFSQTKGIRTAGAIFRATSLELLRGLTSGGAHFVRCLRTDLGQGSLQPAVVRQQLRALAVVDTARARQTGFSYRVPFNEFLRRYKFLAFDFDENVDETKDNCRLLLVRLKLEGYFMGKSKVFLKYYNEEYLSRLYETQVKKIVKVQCMLRAFLAKRNVAQKKKITAANSLTASFDHPEMSEDSAAIIIQKHMKGYTARKKYGPLINTTSGKLDNMTASFIRSYFRRWRAKSMFQVLLHYRAARHQDLVYFSQQVHLYSQNVIGGLECGRGGVPMFKIMDNLDAKKYIGEAPPAVMKLPFNLREVPYADSSPLCGTYRANYIRQFLREETSWDDPFTNLDKGCQTSLDGGENYSSLKRKKTPYCNFIDTPYCRDADFVENAYREQRYVEMHNNMENRARVVKQKRGGGGGAVQTQTQTQTGTGAAVNGRSYYRSHSPSFNAPGDHRYGSRQEPPRARPRSESSNINDFVDNNNGPVDFRKNLRETGKMKNFNPIAELEMKAKQINKDSENNEDPPFNFQAMLRKTNYKRESLRRSFDYDEENNLVEERCPSRTGFRSAQARRDEARPLPEISRGKKERAPLLRRDSLESIKLMVAAAKDFGGDKETGGGGGSNYYEEVTAELLPGLVFVGHVADL